jgi:hypothetical protein
VCRPSSALGLEQPGDAVDIPAPEPEKAFDATIHDTVPATIGDTESSVLPKIPTPVGVETGRTKT